MSDDTLTIKDMLASATADADQAQALIDDARVAFKDDAVFQKLLDEQQLGLDLRRSRIKIIREINNLIA